MAGRQTRATDRPNTTATDTDGKLRLTLHAGHLEPANYLVALPQTPARPAEAGTPPTAVEADGNSEAADPIVTANRARLAALRELRDPTPVDVNDALHGGFWILMLLLLVGSAIRILLELGYVWAAGIAFVVCFGGLLTFVGVLERRESELARRYRKDLADPPPHVPFHWGLMTPASVMRRVRAHLNALNVDDSELEDALEPLYRHGTDPYDFGTHALRAPAGHQTTRPGPYQGDE